MSVWAKKPCARCGGAKGPKHAGRKYCYRCSQQERRDQGERAHRIYVARTYQLAAADYDRLHRIQDGRCAICQRATGASRRLCVDHDHATGKVRGLLCRPCNDMLGHGRDDPDFFTRAWQYLVSPPASQLVGAGG
jgi:hypothetical protein